jgi:ferredoxin
MVPGGGLSVRADAFRRRDLQEFTAETASEPRDPWSQAGVMLRRFSAEASRVRYRKCLRCGLCVAKRTV